MVFELLGPDWTLVIITAIYVLATVILCIINWRSNCITKKQYADQMLREVMPYFKIECESVDAFTSHANMSINLFTDDTEDREVSAFKMSVKNVGLGTAVNNWCFWAYNVNDKQLYKTLNHDVEMPNALTVGEEKEIIYHINHLSKESLIKKETKEISLIVGISYDDLYATNYIQKIEVCFTVNETENGDVLIIDGYHVHNPW